MPRLMLTRNTASKKTAGDKQTHIIEDVKGFTGVENIK